MWKKRILSLAVSLSMAVSVAPVLSGINVSAEEPESLAAAMSLETDGAVLPGDIIYREDFESSSIKSDIENQRNGWTQAGEGPRAIAIDNGYGTGSKGLRFSSTEYGLTNSASIDIKESAVSKGISESVFESLVSDQNVLCFQYGFDADLTRDNGVDYQNLYNGSQTLLEVKNADGTPFMALEAYVKDKATDDVTVNLIALNDDGTANVRYELYRGTTSIFKIVHKLQMILDPYTNTYQLQIDGKMVQAGAHGSSIPASTSSEVGKGGRASSLKPGKITIGSIQSNWYGGVILDNITLGESIHFTSPAQAPENPMSMWYSTPAQEWAQSLPLGNGRVGAMVWGNVLNDTVSLNDVTAWSGQDHTDLNLDTDNRGSDYLKNMQDELQKEHPDYNYLNNEMKKWGGKDNPWTGTHRPFGKLDFQFENPGETVTGYRRSLDLESALSSVNYTANGADFSRESFISNPDQVLVMKYSANQSGKVAFDVNFSTEENNGGSGKTTAGADYLEWNGAVFNYENKEYPITDGVKTFAYMKAINTGGQVTYDENGLHVSGADDVVLIVSLGTNFTAGENFVQNTKENCMAQLDAAAAKGYDTLKKRHVEDVKPRFDRMKVEIGPADQLRAAEPVDVRLEKIRNGAEIEGSFMSLWYQYARYLMIAGSRENSPMPMNLQGIWNDNVAANMAWTCDYHLDINIQMNQWMSNSANLSEGEMPIFNFLENILIPNGERTAQLQYGTKAGWVTSIMTNAWGNTSNSGTVGAWHGNTTCGAWLMQEVMNYFQHTWDTDFLENRGYPMLKSTADFYMEFMIEHQDKDGNTYWVTAPSSSPEHGQIEMMSTMEITVISDIFQQVLNCYEYLNKPQDEYYNAVKAKLEKIAPYKVLENGSLAEWPYNNTGGDEANGDTAHRHTSHLLGLFPYAQITPDQTPELAQASLISMQKRFDRSDFEHTEWTAVNAQGQYARLKDADNAYKYLKLQGDTFTWPNLLSISPEGIALAPCDVYIIDGTFGIGQATAEMLLQSHSNRLEFLPALPKEWKEGNIEGMSAEGAFEVNFAWDDYTLKSAQVTSKAGNTCSIYKNAAINWQNVEVCQKEGETLTPVDTSKSTVSLLTFDTVENGVYVLVDKNLQGLQTGRLINDTDSRIQYSAGFQYNGTRENKGDYYNDAHYAQNENETAEFTFTGTGIDILAATDETGSGFEVYIDNQKHGDGTTLTDQPYAAQQAVYSLDDLAYGTHTVKVVKKSGQYLVLDGFAIRGQYFHYIDDNSPMITYGEGWTYDQNRRSEKEGDFHDYSGTLHYTDKKESSLTVDFSGTGIEVLSEKNQAYGDIEFELDGVNMGTVSITSPPNGTREGASNVWQATGLPNGDHQLKITNKGGGAWDWGWGAIDGFILLNDGGTMFNSGDYRISNLDTDQILTADGNTLVQDSTVAGATYQKWFVDDVDGRYFRLISAHNGIAVTLGDNHADALMRPVDITNEEQLFEFVPYSGDLTKSMIMSKTVGQYLQINGGHEATNNAATVGLYPLPGDENVTNEFHFLWQTQEAGDGLITIQNQVGTYFSVDPGNTNAAGARVLMWQKQKDTRPHWKIENADNDTFTITNIQNGLQIVDDGGVTLAEAGGTNNKWELDNAKQNGVAYYTFKNAGTGNALEIGSNRKWKLARIDQSASAMPYIRDIEVQSPILNDQAVNATYRYGSQMGTETEESAWEVYVLDGISSALTNPVDSGSATADKGFQFTPTGYDPDKILVVKITPAGGEAFYKVISPQTYPVENLTAEVSASEDFSGAGILNTIKNSQNGWYKNGDKVAYTIEASKSGKQDALQFKSENWWSGMNLGLDFTNSANQFSALSGEAYVEFDAMFDAYNDTGASDCRMYTALKSGNTLFGAVRMTRGKLELIAMGAEGKNFTKPYLIAEGVDAVHSKWFNFKFYVDIANNLYALAVNDTYVRNDDGGLWFRPAGNAISLMSQQPLNAIGSVTGIELGHQWSGSGYQLLIDNLKTGHYTMADPDQWFIRQLEPVDGELIYGKANDVSISMAEIDAVQNGVVMVGLYQDREDVLVDSVRFEDVTFDSQGRFDKTFQISVPKVGGDYTLKAFAWTASQQPLGKVYESKVKVSTAFTMPNVFSDNMMLQADKQAAIWGTALAGDEVQVELYDELGKQTVETKTVTADENGNWETALLARESGGKYTLTATCEAEKLIYQNLIFGDVYVLAGQSNMEYWMSGLKDTLEDLQANPARANNPNIRSVNLLNNKSGAAEPQENFPQTDRSSTWLPMNYDEAWLASQIGYYFAQELNEDLDRPIGLISTAVGGTGIDRWKVGGDLFNHRVYPCRKLEVSGVLFYQGEADENMKPEKYSDTMAGLIDGYRDLFGDAELPFYYAQLARFSKQDFKTIRAAQFWAMSKVQNSSNVAMISTLDEVGSMTGSDSNGNGNARYDIHPYGKAEIAGRFAARAKHDIYGMDEVSPSGPVYRSKRIDGSKLELTFDCTGSLKVMAPDDQGKYQYADNITQTMINNKTIDAAVLNEFEICGADGRYYKAAAEISGNKVILSSPEVANPVHARYAFSAYPEAPNLTDDSGMSSYAFSTEFVNS